MPFSEKVKEDAMIACGRHCCICDKFCGNKMEVHHIIPQKDGGEDTFENAIPLCFDCHAEVGSYNIKHPKGVKFSQSELKRHRDKCYERYGNTQKEIDIKQTVFSKNDLWEHLGKPLEIPLSRGFKTLDDFTPLYRNSIVLVAGYSSTGKSLFVQNIVRTNLKAKKKFPIFPLKKVVKK